MADNNTDTIKSSEEDMMCELITINSYDWNDQTTHLKCTVCGNISYTYGSDYAFCPHCGRKNKNY